MDKCDVNLTNEETTETFNAIRELTKLNFFGENSGKNKYFLTKISRKLRRMTQKSIDHLADLKIKYGEPIFNGKEGEKKEIISYSVKKYSKNYKEYTKEKDDYNNAPAITLVDIIPIDLILEKDVSGIFLEVLEPFLASYEIVQKDDDTENIKFSDLKVEIENLKSLTTKLNTVFKLK